MYGEESISAIIAIVGWASVGRRHMLLSSSDVVNDGT